MKIKEGEELFFELMKHMGMDKRENISMMMQMMGSFTLIRFINTFGAIGTAATKEQLLELNARLNQISKK